MTNDITSAISKELRRLDAELMHREKALEGLQNTVAALKKKKEALEYARELVSDLDAEQQERENLPSTVEVRNPRLSNTGLKQDILNMLPSLIEQHPKGPMIKQIAAAISANEFDVRPALRQLSKESQIIYYRRKDSPAYHVLLPGQKPPPEELSMNQHKVMETIIKAADGRAECKISNREICEASNCSKGSIVNVLDALILRDYLRKVSTGSGSASTVFEILKETDGSDYQPSVGVPNVERSQSKYSDQTATVSVPGL